MDASLYEILLEMAEERSMPSLLSRLVERLRGLPDVALARIWLIQPGDICEHCPARPDCPDQTECLHLEASAATSIDPDSGADWFRTDGSYRRFPLGVRHIGNIGATGTSLLVHDAASDPEWFARGDWLEKERVQSFAGHPLVFRNEVLGVLGLFRRTRIEQEEFRWLRAFADHAAAAIANARAFEEIERLKERIELENEYLQEEVRAAHGFGDGGIVGESLALRRVLEQIELVAPTDSSVLIAGESGTGKELLARAIHDRSGRRTRPMVKVNCGAIPRDLFESEFFGHVQGAFTGAVNDRVGRFQLADRGTLFLDEVAEIPIELQSKLLRVLQEGTFERVGDATTRRVDVRVVAATNQDLESRVASGAFREDLFYRLNVFPIRVAPLRERVDDIPSLAAQFLDAASHRLGARSARLTKANVATLQQYDWPGNIRELQNVIERAVITARSGPLRFDLPTSSAATSPERSIMSYDRLKDIERGNLLAALEVTGWRIAGPGGAAELLGVNPSTLRSRLRAMGLTLERRAVQKDPT